jgi:hypothetical protein
LMHRWNVERPFELNHLEMSKDKDRTNPTRTYLNSKDPEH